MRTICISLLEYPERKEAAEKHFNEIGMDVEFYEGINASKMNITCTKPYMEDRKVGDDLFFAGPHCTGIFLSHYSLWSALSLMPQEHTMILEIDAEFKPDWKQRLDQAMEDCPKDFDWLFIGSCCAGRERFNQDKRVKGDVYEIRWPMCFHSYVLSKKAIPHLLKTNRDCFCPIDISTKLHSFKEMKVFSVLPRLSDQRGTQLTT